MDDTREDRQAIQPVLRQIMMYPLADYDGRMKSTDWSTLPKLPFTAGSAGRPSGSFRKIFDQLATVLADAPPLPGEEGRYAQALAVLEAMQSNPRLKPAMIKAAAEAGAALVDPLFEFRNFGQQLPGHWRTIANGAAFGLDYLTRTPWRNPTSWSTRRCRRNISIWTSMHKAAGSTAPTTIG